MKMILDFNEPIGKDIDAANRMDLRIEDLVDENEIKKMENINCEHISDCDLCICQLAINEYLRRYRNSTIDFSVYEPQRWDDVMKLAFYYQAYY